MKGSIVASFSFLVLFSSAFGQEISNNVEEQNKEAAYNFFYDLWFTNNTDNYKKYVADSYVVHDIGERKEKTEEAIEQKQIADFFWENGIIKPEINYQIAEGDLVATRWIVRYEPKTLTGKILIGSKPLPIINVFRYENGKIVEIWNHRHDIDTNRTMKYVFQGLLIGLIIALIPAFLFFRLRRKLKRIEQ